MSSAHVSLGDQLIRVILMRFDREEEMRTDDYFMSKCRKQVMSLAKFFGASFLWSFFKWFWSGIGDNCGFDNFPTLGFQAFAHTFYFDFRLTYIGVGMICPHIVNCSVMLGAIISWGIMWPLISSQEGKWFAADLSSSDFKGLYGYKVSALGAPFVVLLISFCGSCFVVLLASWASSGLLDVFIAAALILGDGLYNFVKISFITGKTLYIQSQTSQQLPMLTGVVTGNISVDEKRRDEVFLKEGVPLWVATSGYVALAAISMMVIPQMFPSVTWYFVLGAYILAPVLAFCNAYGCGLTDWSLGTTYGKIGGLFVFAGWAGTNGGVLAGLVGCGLVMTIVTTAADLMQDIRTGYLTLSSPRSMFVSQLLGTVIGCVIATLTFWLFWISFDVGDPNGEYKAPNGVLFRAMSIVGVEGFSALLPHCLEFCYVAFALAVVLNIIRDLVPQKVASYIPIPMAMGIPFYIGAYFAIDMFIGSVILFAWQTLNNKEADIYSAVVASGLICRDGIWSVPAALLSLAKINPPSPAPHLEIY